MAIRRTMWLLAALAVPFLSSLGCDAPQARYRLNMAFARKMERQNMKDAEGNIRSLSHQQLLDSADILTALFGTPDEPHMPVIGDVDGNKIVNVKYLKMAAGPVGMVDGRAVGLYREHCVHCHGITGDGAGPTAAFLNPYPRDYRKGVFKFKSSKKGDRPTHDDLRRVIMEGVAGTAMPSFKLLSEQEVEALIDYVKYLTMRGEAERALLTFATEQEEPEKGQVAALVNDKTDPKEQLAEVLESVALAMSRWPESKPVDVPEPTKPMSQEDRESIARGKALFYGAVANCFSCHGDSGLGDGQRDFYDDWSGEWADKQPPEAVREYVALGALEPRKLVPRNLRHGAYRGGRRPIDLYWRIVNGIDGAQMPAAPMKGPDDGPEVKKLTPDDVWDIINYVRSLPYESISVPSHEAAELLKERT